MSKPNYQWERRKRDLEKKAKKEEKRRRKLETPASPAGTAAVVPAAEPSPVAPPAA